jgi:hypothetical protein
MTIFLIENGKALGAIKNFRRLPGEEHYETIDVLGGESERVLTHKDPDRCTFAVDCAITRGASHALQETNGEPVNIKITHVSFLNGTSTVIAFTE